MLAGRYRLDTLLGRGGMAVVWRALDEQLDREVAVKAVDLSGPDSDKAAERFRKEARTTARLNHSNIVTVFDSGVDGQTAYIVMELLSGPTLAAELLEHGPMEFDEVRRIGQQVCAGLAAAHEAGVIHRDIKPGNIAYTADGTVKVLDFGITQLVDEAMGLQSSTAPQTVLGTAEYLSPEQASAMPIDARADLYAFGCVLAALLTGQPPYVGDTSVSVLLQHTQAPLPDFAARRPDMPRGFVELLHDLLAKDRFDRPRTAKEVQARLAGLSLWPPSEEPPPGPDFPAAAASPVPVPSAATPMVPTPGSPSAGSPTQGSQAMGADSRIQPASEAPHSATPGVPAVAPSPGPAGRAQDAAGDAAGEASAEPGAEAGTEASPESAETGTEGSVGPGAVADGEAPAGSAEAGTEASSESAEAGTEASAEPASEAGEPESQAGLRTREPWIPPRPPSRITVGQQHGSTQVIAAASTGETRASRAAARSSIRHSLVLWILAAAAVLLLVILWLAGRDGSAGASTTSANPPTTPTAATSRSATTPSTTAAAEQVSSPEEALALMRLTVSQTRKAREIDARAALALNRRLDEISAALRDTRPDRRHDPSQLVNDLAKTINELADQGHITYAGQQLLADPFASLQRQVPPPSA